VLFLDVLCLLRKKLSLILLVAAVVISGMLVAGCTDQTAQEATSKGTVSIGYVLWDSEIASTNVLKQVFEKAGYDVELKAVDAGPLYQALADGDVDCTISAWLPGTQASYWEKYGDDIDLVRHNLDGAKCGLVVPDYVTIDSIDEMNGVKDKFDKRITGIESGAGIMENTEKAIKSYDLDYELLPSSSAAMAAELSKAYKENEWIVVTGWTPHWMFVRFNLKYLDDPKGFYGEEEYIGTLAKKGLKEEKPGVYEILERFHWNTDDLESVMLSVEGGASEEDAASEWIKSHPDMVTGWIGN